jgi:hypothetical protein
LIHDSAAKFVEAGDKYQFPGACTLAVADMMAWMKSAYPGIAVERKTIPCGGTGQSRLCGFGHHVQVPKGIFFTQEIQDPSLEDV